MSSQQPGLRTLVLSVSVGGVLLLTGCGGDKRKAQTPDPALKQMAREEMPSVYRPVTAATVDSGGRSIRQPRSQSELQDIYSRPSEAIAARPSAPRVQQIQTPVAQDTGAVTADPEWDVPIAREWRHIVIHHSAGSSGSASAFDKAHRERGWDGLGYHFVIGNGSLSGDGEVEVGYRWKRQMQGAHAGNAEYNQAGVGICLVGDFQNGGRPTTAQLAAVRRLTRFLQVKCGIPTYEVIGHGNVPGKSTECPGRALDMGDFRASLGNGAIGNYQIANKKGSSSNSHMVRRQTSSTATP